MSLLGVFSMKFIIWDYVRILCVINSEGGIRARGVFCRVRGDFM